MSSSLCFLCHSTVNSETSEDIRDKFKDIVGMHISPHLCHVCCHMVRKLYHFRATCLKRSLEYPVLFRERGTLNLQKNHLESVALCPAEECQPPEFPMTNFYMNSKLYHLKQKHSHEDNTHIDESSTGHNQYVDLELNDRTINIKMQTNHFNDELVNDITNRATEIQDNWEHSGSGNKGVGDKSIEQYQYVDSEHNDNDTDGQPNYLNDDKSTEQNQYVDLEQNKKDTDGEISYFNGEQVNDTDNQGDENQASCYDSDNDGDYYVRSTNGSDEESRVSPDLTGETETNIESKVIKEVPDDILEQFEAQEDTTTQEEPPSTSKKKPKKKSFERIVLTFQEQKAVLKAQRKEKKYLEATYKCHSCALGFLFQDTYQSHMVRHEESNGQFNCNVCGLRFATQNARAMHVNLHAEIYKCNKCSAEVKRPHRNRHSRDCWRAVDTASCHLCGKEFRDANCLQQHLRRFHTAKSSSRVYPCSVCGKTYPDPGVLRTHIIKHISGRFSCPECPASFTSPYTLRQHRRRHAPDAGRALPDAFHCAACGTSYESKKSLDAHLKNTLRHQQRSFECALCPRKFPTAHTLRRHAAGHAPASRDCALCGARCRSQAALLRHKGAHRARPTLIVCHICGKGFKCKSKLNRHVREVCEKAKIEEELATFYEQESVLEQIQAAVGT